MNLFQMATRGVDLDALPDEDAPRPLIDFGPSASPASRMAVPVELDSLFDAAASEYGVDPTILKGIAYAESRFRPDIISGKVASPAGAVGLMQFMPATAKEMGINPLDPVESVFGAAAYLRQSLDKFGGDTERAVASYNWGRNRTAFDREDWYKALPAETRNYVGTVLEFADGVAPKAGAAPGQMALPDGVAPSQAGGGRGAVNPAPGTVSGQEKKPFIDQVKDNLVGGAKSLASMHPALAPLVRAFSPEEPTTTAAPSRNEFAPVDEAKRGLKTGGTGLKQMWESNVILKDAMLASAQGDFLNAFDRIDAGDKNVPRAVGLAYQQAGPEERQRLREMVQGRLAERRGFIDASLDTMRQYQADMQKTKGRVTDLTDVEGVKDFTNWLAFNGGAGLATMGPLMVTAVLSGPAAPVTVGALGLGMATGEVNNDRIEYAQKQGMDAQGVGEYVAKNTGSTIATAIPFAALDVAAGPVGSVVGTMAKGGLKELQRMGVKQAAKEVGKDVAEEGITGGLQEALKLNTGYALGETDALLTKENAKKVLNSAAAEAAGGLVGGAARVTGQAMVQGPVPQVQDQSTTPQAPVVAAVPDNVPQAPVVPLVTPSATAEAQPVAQTAQPADASTPAATQAVDNIEALMGQQVQPAAAPSAPAAEQAAATVEQAEQQLAAREMAQAAPVEMQMRTTGTLFVKGDPVALRARLTPAGVDNTIAVPGGLIVARSQAAKAQEVLSAPAQTTTPTASAVTPQQEAANVPQGQTPPAQPAAQAASTTAPALPAADAGVPATGVPAAGGAATAQADGVTGQKIDSEWTAFAPESGTRAVPRAEMPQIKAEHRGAMVNFLKARGVSAVQEEVPAASLKPTQAEFSPAKVAQAKAYTGGDRSILVSSDGYVLDGHHQWLAKREAGEPVKVIRLDAPIADLLPLVKEFPSSTQAEGATAPQESMNADPTPSGVRLADERAPSATPTAQVGQSESAGRPADAQPDARGSAGRSDPAQAVAGMQPAVPAGSGGAAADPVALDAESKPQFSKGMSRELAEAIFAAKPLPRVEFFPATKESVNAALAQLVPTSGRLPNGLGKIVVANAAEIKPHWEPLIGRVEVASESAGRVQGFYDQRTVFLIADHIAAGQEMAVAAHELMHKHGEAVLGEKGWKQLHEVIGTWAGRPEGSLESRVYNEAVRRVDASRPEGADTATYSSEELFPYAVQVAMEMGVQPSITKPVGTVAGWLAHVRGALSRTWAKMTAKPDLFDSLDLVDLAFAIAQRENPDTGTALDVAADGQVGGVPPSALEEFSKADDLFALPKSTKDTIEGIVAEHDPDIQVRKTSFPGNETMYTLNMPQGQGVARITVRASTDSSVYDARDTGDGEYSWETGRPGANPDDVPAGTEDVWIDVSNLKPGKRGDMVYNIAATFAHNTGRIFIGDPNGLTTVALRRRLEHMISSALKFGTTEHLAPHPNQVRGGNGVPPLRWVYGDHEGNVERMIAASVQALDNAYPDSQNIAYDPARGFYRTDTGETQSRGQLADGLRKSIAQRRAGAGGDASTGQGGWRTVARAALFRHFQSAIENDSGADRGRLLDRIGQDVTGLQRRGTADGAGSSYPDQERIFYSRATADNLKSSMGAMTPGQEAAWSKAAGIKTPPTLKERAAQMKANFSTKARQGIVDQFAPIADLDQKAYMLARMSKGSDGTMEAALLYGRPFLRDGVPDVDVNEGGFARVLAGLKGEHDRFLWWVAALRAENLKAQGKENLLDTPDIDALKTLNAGTMADGSDRVMTYAEALLELNDFNNAVLQMAKDSGLIDQSAVDLFKDQPYVPFYRLADETGQMQGPRFSAGLTNQKAWKKLKGGTQQINADLLQNMLMNWSSLYGAAARNRAALATMDAAEQLAVAYQVPEGTKGAAKVMRDGITEHWAVEDPYLLEAISALNYTPSSLMKALSAPKRLLTWAVTVNPTFKVRNLIRDSISAIAQADLSYNALGNVAKGWQLTASDSQVYASMLASGGIIKFGTQENTDRLRNQVAKLGGTLLDEGAAKKMWGMVKAVGETYQEVGDRTENVNRAALYDRLIKKGYNHADASFMARDLMDFSMSGNLPLVRFLTQTVPFLNARLQGLYKLGRAAGEDPARFAAVVAAVSMASLALMAAYHDDEDWKKREDWDRDAYWWFKIGKVAFRIPKPFEVGALGTLAERTAELIFSKEMDNKRFMERLRHMLASTFSLDPIPQAIKPLLDVSANKDSFTGRAIETQADQKLRPKDRYSERTPEIARLLGSWGLPDPLRLVKGEWSGLSPKQVEHLMRGYFSWVATVTFTVTDTGARAFLDKGEKPAMRMKDIFMAGNFIESLPSGSSRYVSKMYEQAREADQAYASYQSAVKAGDKEKELEIRTKDLDKLKNHERLQDGTKALTRINAYARMVEANKTMTADQKRDRLEALEQQRHKIASTVIGVPSK